MSIQIFGIQVSRGVAIGRAVVVASSRLDVAHYYVPVEQVPQEVNRLRQARDTVATELAGLKRDMPGDAPPELAALLDVHLMLLHDDTVADATKAWVQTRHYNAEWALSAQLEVLARQFDDMEDAYLRERKADIEQVVERLQRALRVQVLPPTDTPIAAARNDGTAPVASDDHPLILVAADVAPADMVQFKRSVFQGFVTDVGGRTSHTAIVARSMDIPAVVGAREASRIIHEDDWLIVDGEAGVVIVNPSNIVLEEYRFKQRQSQLERERLSRLSNTRAITLDGQAVELLANIESPADTAGAIANGAVGVGLFRTEFLFMNRGGALPDEEEQFQAYRAAVLGMQGHPVTIRTVDIGADKPLERLSAQELRHEHGLNPALGLRAIRWSLSEPTMFAQQLRALLRVSSIGPVKILIPMLAHEAEIHATQAALSRAKAQLRAAGVEFGQAPVGAMIEVPAAAVSINLFLKHFDFVSIGTNDLIQYTLAIDRADETVAHLYDPWHPAVLTLLRQVIDAARLANKPVSVCGEMAGDPAFTETLLAMGLRSFSMHPSCLATVKQRILRSNAEALSEQPELQKSVGTLPMRVAGHDARH